jgi:hypothetical protein
MLDFCAGRIEEKFDFLLYPIDLESLQIYDFITGIYCTKQKLDTSPRTEGGKTCSITLVLWALCECVV